MRKATTISDVAAEAGVTKQAVSLALRGKPGVSDATRQRIIAIAAELDYQPAPTRQTRGPVHRGQIGFLHVSADLPAHMGPMANPVQYLFLLGCERQAAKLGSSIALCQMTTSDLQKGDLPVALLRKHVDGVVVHGWKTRNVAEALRSLHLPFVLADCDMIVPGTHQIQIDHALALDQLAPHLAAEGGRQCAMITGDLAHLNGQERLSEAQRALPTSGMTLHNQAISQQDSFSALAGERGVADLLQRGVPFDTLICQSDLIAAGALSALAEAGLEKRVAGFDNLEFPQPVTSIDTHSYAQAEMAAELLLTLIQNPDLPPSLHRHPVELVIRNSSLALANQT